MQGRDAGQLKEESVVRFQIGVANNPVVPLLFCQNTKLPVLEAPPRSREFLFPEMDHRDRRRNREVLFPVDYLIEVLVGVLVHSGDRLGATHPEIGGIGLGLHQLLANHIGCVPRVLEVKHLHLPEEVVVLPLHVLNPRVAVSVAQELLHGHLHLVRLNEAIPLRRVGKPIRSDRDCDRPRLHDVAQIGVVTPAL